MKNITFGNLIENLLYISNQKKTSLAKYIGYDISYVNKWIKSTNLPSSKRVNEICKNISSFIVESLNESTYNHLIEYFEIDKDSSHEYLSEYIEQVLRDTYMDTISSNEKFSKNMPKNTHAEEYYNSLSLVKPNVIEKGILSEIDSYIKDNED